MPERNKHYLRNREDELTRGERIAVGFAAGAIAAGAGMAVHARLNDVAEQRQPEATTTTTIEVTEVPDPGEPVQVERGGQDIPNDELQE